MAELGDKTQELFERLKSMLDGEPRESVAQAVGLVNDWYRIRNKKGNIGIDLVDVTYELPPSDYFQAKDNITQRVQEGLSIKGLIIPYPRELCFYPFDNIDGETRLDFVILNDDKAGKYELHILVFKPNSTKREIIENYQDVFKKLRDIVVDAGRAVVQPTTAYAHQS